MASKGNGAVDWKEASEDLYNDEHRFNFVPIHDS